MENITEITPEIKTSVAEAMAMVSAICNGHRCSTCPFYREDGDHGCIFKDYLPYDYDWLVNRCFQRSDI